MAFSARQALWNAAWRIGSWAYFWRWIMKELVEVIARALVDNPDEVVVTEKTEGKNVIIELHVAASDMGKVIGKQGRIAKSIRSVVKAASSKENQRVDVEII